MAHVNVAVNKTRANQPAARVDDPVRGRSRPFVPDEHDAGIFEYNHAVGQKFVPLGAVADYPAALDQRTHGRFPGYLGAALCSMTEESPTGIKFESHGARKLTPEIRDDYNQRI
jgi:hypothetical protein